MYGEEQGENEVERTELAEIRKAVFLAVVRARKGTVTHSKLKKKRRKKEGTFEVIALSYPHNRGNLNICMCRSITLWGEEEDVDKESLTIFFCSNPSVNFV